MAFKGDLTWMAAFPRRAQTQAQVIPAMVVAAFPLLHSLIDMGFSNGVLPLAQTEMAVFFVFLFFSCFRFVLDVS